MIITVHRSDELPVKDYMFSIALGNPKNPYMSMCDGYTGEGGIPGYIFELLVPNEYTISRIKVALTHECNEIKFDDSKRTF